MHLWKTMRKHRWDDSRIWLHIEDDNLKNMKFEKPDILRFHLIQNELRKENQRFWDQIDIESILKMVKENQKMIGTVLTGVSAGVVWMLNRYRAP